eukprot:12913468-Alexandrium_andersonii.AAC.1
MLRHGAQIVRPADADKPMVEEVAMPPSVLLSTTADDVAAAVTAKLPVPLPDILASGLFSCLVLRCDSVRASL